MLQHLRIGSRLALGFAVTIAAALGIAFFARAVLLDIQSDLLLLTGNRMVKVEELEAIKDRLNLTARSVRNLALLTDAERMKPEQQRIQDSRTDIQALMQKLQTSLTTDEGQRLLAQVAAMLPPYVSAMDQAQSLALAGQRDEARDALLQTVRPAQNRLFEAVDALITYQRQQMNLTGEAVANKVAHAVALMLGVALAAGVIGLGLAWSITRTITRPIGDAVRLARQVASGDLSGRIVVTRRDEAGELLHALQSMNANLVDIVSEVREASESIHTGSSEVALGSNDLSRRTEQQAASLEETAASMEQLSSAVEQSADTAANAHRAAHGAAEQAQQGSALMGEVIRTMGAISESSSRITDITTVIDGLAFQTNLLALNAAVEAARAGEQGRGFAVVASEVRELALRSAQAAREIRTLIQASVDQVASGGEQVHQAGDRIQDLMQQVRRVRDLMGDISNASNEQSDGLNQIGSAVSLIDQVTQQNAALVEESAAAAQSLSEQAGRLNHIVARFKLDPTARPRIAPAPSAVSALPTRVVARAGLPAIGSGLKP